MVKVRKISAKEHEISDEEWEEILDESYGDVEICGMTFSSGRALKELDPTAFRTGKNDYSSSMYECGKCGTVYESEDEAEACCNEEE